MSATGDSANLASAEEADQFDPRQAAMILAESERNARRMFDMHLAVVALIGAVAALIGYGAIWLSVRGGDQQPYSGPTSAAVRLAYAAISVVVVVGAVTVDRASSGVSGRSQRRRRTQLVVIGAVMAAAGALQSALAHEGANPAIVSGIFPAAGTLILLGLAFVGLSAGREDWTVLGVAAAVVVVGIAAAFAGPAGAWAVAGLGVFVVLLVYALALALQRRTQSAGA